jgi:hypothetical protein
MNVYEYVEDSKDGKRYFYFTGTSPDKIPNLPDPSKATLFIENIQIGNEDKFDPKYPRGCRVKKDSRIPETKYRAASICTTQKYYEEPFPRDIQILSPLYPFWNDAFRGPMRNCVTPERVFRQKDIQTLYFEHTYFVRDQAFQ